MKQLLSDILLKFNIDTNIIEEIINDEALDNFKTLDEVDEEINTKLLDLKLDYEIKQAKPKNEKLCKSLIDMQKISFVNGEIIGLQEEINKIKKENSFLFEETNYSPSNGFNSKNLDDMSDNDYFNFLKQTNGGF